MSTMVGYTPFFKSSLPLPVRRFHIPALFLPFSVRPTHFLPDWYLCCSCDLLWPMEHKRKWTLQGHRFYQHPSLCHQTDICWVEAAPPTLFFFFFFFCLFRPSSVAYGRSQASGWMWPTPQPQWCQIQATLATYSSACNDAISLTHWARPGMDPKFSWILVWFLTHWATTRTPNLVLEWRRNGEEPPVDMHRLHFSKTVIFGIHLIGRIT